MKELLEYIARELVEDPDAVSVEEITDDRGTLLRLTVAPDDMGRVIGRGGRLARAIRSVIRAASIRDGIRVAVDIAEPR